MDYWGGGGGGGKGYVGPPPPPGPPLPTPMIVVYSVEKFIKLAGMFLDGPRTYEYI